MARFLLAAACVLAWLSVARGDEYIRLRNANGMEVDIIPTGACVRRLLLPAADGGPPVDVMMGFEQQDVDKYRVSARQRSTSGIHSSCAMEWGLKGWASGWGGAVVACCRRPSHACKPACKPALAEAHPGSSTPAPQNGTSVSGCIVGRVGGRISATNFTLDGAAGGGA